MSKDSNVISLLNYKATHQHRPTTGVQLAIRLINLSRLLNTPFKTNQSKIRIRALLLQSVFILHRMKRENLEEYEKFRVKFLELSKKDDKEIA